MKRIFWLTTAVLVAAVVLYTLFTLPPTPVRIAATPPSTTAFGAYHIHTNRSDGSGSIDDVARAAADVGLQFVILTDHGDATTTPEPPAYVHGVLVIDGVEITTRDGHLVALGLADAAPYPLGGEARDAIEDVRRLGGWTVAAHPDSPKPDLRWRGPATDGIEWLNADSEWRDEPPMRVLASAGRAFIRAPGTIASLFSRPSASFRRWEQWGGRRHVVGLAAVDAHARIGLDEQSEPRAMRTILAKPSYADMFRTLQQAVWLDRPFIGDARQDAAAVLVALRRGRTYSVVSAAAAPGILDVAHSQGQLEARALGAPEADIVVFNGGREIARHREAVTVPTGAPGLYRIEARWGDSDVPWMVTAPLFEGTVERPSTPEPVADGPSVRLTADGPWAVEKHRTSTASWTRGATDAVTLTYALAGGAPDHQYAALVHPLDTSLSVQAITLTISADRPSRVSVQVRLPDSAGGERWVRSVYADAIPRRVTLPLSDFEPADAPTSRRPVAARLQSILFVVDAPHTRPADRGHVTLSDVILRQPTPAPPMSER